MSELLKQGLLMAAIGMGLVFVTLILFWGLLAAMGRIPARKKAQVEAEPALIEMQEESGAEPGLEMHNLRTRAAAAAVAAALAGQQKPIRSGAATAQTLTPWQASHRFAQFNRSTRFSNRSAQGTNR